jgi:hypothetical protein
MPNSRKLCVLGKNPGKIRFIGFIGITLKNRIYRNINMGSN